MTQDSSQDQKSSIPPASPAPVQPMIINDLQPPPSPGGMPMVINDLTAAASAASPSQPGAPLIFSDVRTDTTQTSQPPGIINDLPLSSAPAAPGPVRSMPPSQAAAAAGIINDLPTPTTPPATVVPNRPAVPAQPNKPKTIVQTIPAAASAGTLPPGPPQTVSPAPKSAANSLPPAQPQMQPRITRPLQPTAAATLPPSTAAPPKKSVVKPAAPERLQVQGQTIRVDSPHPLTPPGIINDMPLPERTAPPSAPATQPQPDLQALLGWTADGGQPSSAAPLSSPAAAPAAVPPVKNAPAQSTAAPQGSRGVVMDQPMPQMPAAAPKEAPAATPPPRDKNSEQPRSKEAPPATPKSAAEGPRKTAKASQERLRPAAAQSQEVDIWWGAYSGWSMLPAFLLCLTLTAAILWCSYEMAPADLHPWTVLALTGALWSLQLFCWLYRSLGYHYRLTTRRLYVERGWLYAGLIRVELSEIHTSAARSGLSGLFLGVGRVVVEMRDKTQAKITLEGVYRPAQLARKIEELRKQGGGN